MQDAERGSGRVAPFHAAARLRTSARALGFAAPPAVLRLKLVEGPHYWSLFLQPEGNAGLGSVVDWLEPWSPLRIEFGTRQVIRADFDPLPTPWRRLFHRVELQMLVLFPNGSAVATVVGKHAALASFGRALAEDRPPGVDEVRDAAPRDKPLLTPAQDSALRTAVDAGYYLIPRPVNLRELATRMGISSASLSERLRRAEARVIMRYAKDGGVTPWDARTIFAAHPRDHAADAISVDLQVPP